jgi:hypothetical protein
MTTETEKTDADKKSGNLLVETARAIGKAAGTVASTVVHHETPASESSTPPSAPHQVKRGKLPKRNKTRLPRREKKALVKAELRAQVSPQR